MLKTAAIAVVASLLTTIGVLLAFPHFMRPTPPRYRYEHSGPASLLVRIDEQSGEAEQLIGNTWTACHSQTSGATLPTPPDSPTSGVTPSTPTGVQIHVPTTAELEQMEGGRRPDVIDQVVDKNPPKWERDAYKKIDEIIDAGYRLSMQDELNIEDEYKKAATQPGIYQLPTPYELTHDLQRKQNDGQ